MVKIERDALYSAKDLKEILGINNNHASEIMKNVPRYEATRPFLVRGTYVLAYIDENSK